MVGHEHTGDSLKASRGVGGQAVSSERLSWTALLSFGSISMPVSLLAIGLFMFLPTVYSASSGIAMQDVGLIIFATRLWDFVTDPLVGWLSDKTRTRFGRRIPWMTLAWLPLSISAYKLFLPPPGVGASYLAFWSFVLFLSGTSLFMPYTAMGAELSTSYHERSRIFGYRHVFAVLGTLSAALLFWFVNKPGVYNPEADALELIAWVGLILLPLALLATLINCRERPVDATVSRADIRWKDGARVMFGNRTYLRVLGCYLFNGIANALPVTLMFFYVRSVLEAPEWTPIILALYFVAAICGTPLWLYLADRWGKHVSWRIALLAAAATLAFVPLLGAGDVFWFMAIALIVGVTLGADLAMPAAMLADVVDQDVLATGRQRTGIYFAVWAMAAKLAAAAAVGVAFPILDWAGYIPDMYNEPGALLTLVILFGLCPVIFKLLAVLFVWRYPLTAEKQTEIRQAIAAQRGG
ncbi:MAG: MFS transporter [Alphaproteobacteria bacterium]|nr:MFS transporter [Alphaproteobacteria bacterium]